MLGRGLEALIPPQQSDGDTPVPPVNDPVVSFGAVVQQDVAATQQSDTPMMLHLHDDEPEEQTTAQPSQPYSFSVDIDESQSSSVSVDEPQSIDLTQEDPYRPAQPLQAPQKEVQPHNYNQELLVQSPATQADPSPQESVRSDFDETEALRSFAAAASGHTAQLEEVSAPSATSTRPHNYNQELSVTPVHQKSMQQAVFHIETDKIVPNPHQPRKEFDPEALQERASSIREFGILQPLVVNKIQEETSYGTKVTYQLIAGERRLRASKLLGLPRVPVLIRQAQSNKEQLELAIIENLQREELNPIEMARAYARLQDEFGMTQREVASRLGKSRATVANTLRLLDLPGDIQDAISEGTISESHGRLLLGVQEPQLQKSLFQDLLQRNMTTRELRDRVKIAKPQKKVRSVAPSPQQLSPELVALQERLSSELGAPVNIQSSGERGKITISFYSQEELSAILERLAKEQGVLL